MTSPVRHGHHFPGGRAVAVSSPDTPLEVVVAHIVNTLAPHFTGHVGPVRFRNGHAETDDPELVAWFRDRPDEYDVDGVDPAVTAEALQRLRDALATTIHGDPADPQE